MCRGPQPTARLQSCDEQGKGGNNDHPPFARLWDMGLLTLSPTAKVFRESVILLLSPSAKRRPRDSRQDMECKHDFCWTLVSLA